MRRFLSLGRPLAWALTLVALAVATVYPTDFERHHAEPRGGQYDPLVIGVEQVGRHVNTARPLLMVIALRDVVGAKQMVAITAAGILATHGPKRLLNDVEIAGTRLGQRPSSATSKHNMPSGHSSLASAGACFMVRRYSHWFGVVVWPIVLLTMYARVMLDAHTVSATIAGAITGVLVAWLFARKTSGLRDVAAAVRTRKRYLTKV
ncbi:hypothetical protein JANAI62_36370 [Jannaschia pagri]|uniref:Phosphatidic acid phosphatase type 2/haloperoxidase domain-containing protein n=1 Tax=Jannaschia pagri TaxID=2829797 RepID=A0ABQ4NRH8_9RHOB|nr:MULTISPECIES: phosphatase PAP2 family protein [unclassified Jannaschia]GIT93219.1 hypothetical protein JANAI61_36770 [Jannaschia sp. AI_61]GIT97014.1 hypothetical protein JANAI62_36370 [Jannaschia sp. AI_62]